MNRNPDPPPGPSGAERATRRGIGHLDAEHDPLTSTGAFARPWPEPQPPRQSRGPEYHPPSVPGHGRERAATASVGSGTFRVGPMQSVQVRTPAPPPLDPPAAPTPRPPASQTRARRADTPAAGRRRRFWVSAAIGLLLGSGVALAVVQVPIRGLGVLKATGVPESLGASVAGTVASVRVAAGDEVDAGDVVLEIHSPELERSLNSERGELELLRGELEAALVEEKAAQARNRNNLERRRQLLTQRLKLKDEEFAQRQALLAEMTAMVNAGTARTTELAEASAAVQATREARLGIVDALSQLDIEVTDRKSEQLERERLRRTRIAEAEAKVRQAEQALGITAVRAPARGWVESLRVSRGSAVQAGAELARLVPRSAPRSVLALVALEDAPYLALGDEVSVELMPQNPRAGRLDARIRHISREVAPAGRVATVIGEHSSEDFVQIELELSVSDEYRAREPELRTGSRVVVSSVARARRLGSILSSAARDYIAFALWR